MMSFNDLSEEINNWQLTPVNKNTVKPMELAKQISGYAIEQQRWDAYHRFMLMSSNKQLQEHSMFAPTSELYMEPEMSTNNYVAQVMQSESDIVSKGMGFQKAA